MYKRRRNTLRQKPWNVPTRAEKFWSVPSSLGNNPAYIDAAPHTPTRIVAITAADLNQDQGLTGVNMRALQNGKLHRFQGAIWAWLERNAYPADTVAGYTMTDDPINATQLVTAGTRPNSNVALLNYVWLKLKQSSDSSSFDVASNTILGATTQFNPFPAATGDLGALLLRDDIISWGSVPVFGCVPLQLSRLKHLVNDSLNSFLVTLPGQYLQGHVCKVPFPRLPKTGLNLRAGEALCCFVATIGGPGGGGDIDEDLLDRGTRVHPQFRMLCSK